MKLKDIRLSRIFIIITAGICLVIIVALLYSINKTMEEELTAEYEEKADMLLHSMKGVRSHIGDVVRPEATEILGEDEFKVELQSTSYAANQVFQQIPEEHRHEITFRTPSTKPMNPDNDATPVEEDLIQKLDRMHREGKDELEWRGIRNVDGEDFYIIAHGAVNEPDCLPCHRQPEDAPESMQERYPFDSPPRLVDRVETAEVTYIPMTSMYETVRDATQFLFILGGLGLLAIVFGVYLLFAKMVSTPLTKLQNYALAVEKGDLDTDVQGNFRGELASLKDSVQSMVVKLKDKITESEEKSREAEQESQKALEAAKEAEEAKKQAEQAKRQGMLDAANRLEEVVERMTSASDELSAQVEQSSRGAEEQKKRTTETATSMEEMNASVLEVARNASSAAQGSDQAKNKAQEGQEVVKQSVEAINKVQKQATSMKESLNGLGQQSQQIGEVMNVIEDIADQTNLLALNAAIEAARAGDAGRGFAVVADEVRKLAEKTMNATKEVGEAVTSIRSSANENIQSMDQVASLVNEATDLANQSGQALQEIVALAEQAADQVRSIATSSEEQSSASEEVSKSMEEIKRISQETAEVMEQSSKAISDLASQAQELKEVVRQLKEEET